MIGSVRYSCPVDNCRWYYDEDSGLGIYDMPGYDNSDPATVRVTDLAGLRLLTERELAVHLTTHQPIDFMITINRLSNELRAALAQSVS